MTQNLDNIGSDGNSADVAGKTKPVGVVPQPNGKWGARIKTDGKLKWLGTFNTVEEAASAVAAVRKKRPKPAGVSADPNKPQGVSLQPNGKWAARVYMHGQIKWLGTFDTVEEAAAVAEEARRKRDEAKPKRPIKKYGNGYQPTSIRYLRNRSFSAEQVQQMIKYDPETGEFFWGPRPLELCNSFEWFSWWNDAMVGKKIAGKRKKKRKYITIRNEKFHLHDVAWAVTYGRWPKRPIIHKNKNVKDNRIENLMEAEA
jgi:hypothetical protein